MDHPSEPVGRNPRSDGAERARIELRQLSKLAFPLIVAQLGNQLMSSVDTAMVGRLGAAQLAGVGISNGIYFTISLVGFGCVLGMDPLVSQAVGAGEAARARRLFSAGARVALLVSIPTVAALLAASFLLDRLGIDPEAAREGRRYLWSRTPNAIPFLFFTAQRSYLQARGATRPILWSMVFANLANFIGNGLLIYGDGALTWAHLPRLGLPALGVIGAGIASSLSSVLSCLVLHAAIRGLDDPQRRDEAAQAEPHGRTILHLGLPLGLQLFAEVGVFALAGVLAGRMSALAAAGHQIALNLASASFGVTVGIGSATAVRVGWHVGRGDRAGARRAGFVGLGAGMAFMSTSALGLLIAPGLLARLLTDDAGVIRAAVPLIMIAAVFQLSDGAQSVAAGALRGAGDTRASFWANLIGHYAVGLPVAIGLGFGLGMGAPGLWWGLSAGLTAVAIGLCARFAWLSKRGIRRAGLGKLTGESEPPPDGDGARDWSDG